MSTDLTTLQPAEAGAPLTAAQLKSRLAVIQSVMRDVMQKDVDFGVIPGTQKPTLFKPGAEKLCVTFRLAPDDPLIEAVPELTGDIRYRVRVPVRASDGAVIAVGVGECSTGEEKYRWRRPVHQKEYDAAPEDRKRQKYQRNGDVWEQVRVEPADVANTVLKMAHKRAYIHAVIMATAAGAIFTQDVEDLPDGVDPDADQTRKAPALPQRKSEPPPASGVPSAARRVTVRVADLVSKDGQGDKGPWTRWTLTGSDREKYGTFDSAHADVARQAREAGLAVTITYVTGKYGRDITAIALDEREPGAEG